MITSYQCVLSLAANLSFSCQVPRGGHVSFELPAIVEICKFADKKTVLRFSVNCLISVRVVTIYVCVQLERFYISSSPCCCWCSSYIEIVSLDTISLFRMPVCHKHTASCNYNCTIWSCLLVYNDESTIPDSHLSNNYILCWYIYMLNRTGNVVDCRTGTETGKGGNLGSWLWEDSWVVIRRERSCHSRLFIAPCILFIDLV